MLNKVEEAMVPMNYKVEVPAEYGNLPKLQGRAVVEMTFKKEGGKPFDIEGTNFPEAKMKVRSSEVVERVECNSAAYP